MGALSPSRCDARHNVTTSRFEGVEPPLLCEDAMCGVEVLDSSSDL